MASEPPDTPLDDELPVNPEPSGRRALGRSCLTIVAAIGVAGALMAGCTALTVAKLDELFEGLEFDFRLPEDALGCTLWRNAYSESQRTQALDVLQEAAKTDPSLAAALFAGPEAVDRWCAARGYA